MPSIKSFVFVPIFIIYKWGLEEMITPQLNKFEIFGLKAFFWATDKFICTPPKSFTQNNPSKGYHFTIITHNAKSNLF